MIGALRQWCRRMFAPRYWPKVGANAPITIDFVYIYVSNQSVAWPSRVSEALAFPSVSAQVLSRPSVSSEALALPSVTSQAHAKPSITGEDFHVHV